MKKIVVCLALVSGALTSPICFAQSNGPVTRAEVRADLVRVERAGFTPSAGDDSHYPADIQAAEAKVSAQKDPQGFGGVTQRATTSSGSSLHTSMHGNCVGPVSFCNTFFGS